MHLCHSSLLLNLGSAGDGRYLGAPVKQTLEQLKASHSVPCRAASAGRAPRPSALGWEEAELSTDLETRCVFFAKTGSLKYRAK